MSKSLNHSQIAILNGFQKDFPLVSRPFAKIGAQFNMTESEVITEIAALMDSKVVSRIGAAVGANRARASTLAAMAVSAERLEDVAEIVTAQPEVNHNYEREHDYNLWFVVTSTDQEALEKTLRRIERLTGTPVLNLPLEKPYHIDLGFRI